MMETLVAESESIRQGIGDTVVRNLKVMARMGVIFEDLMRRQYPEFPLRGGVRSWEEVSSRRSAKISCASPSRPVDRIDVFVCQGHRGQSSESDGSRIEFAQLGHLGNVI